MGAAAALENAGDPIETPLAFAGSFRRWLLTLPPRIGWNTLRACLRLWAGWGPDRSGVPLAALMPAARAVVLGVVFGSNRARLMSLVRETTTMTHVDAAAIAAAQAVARIARGIATGVDPDAAVRTATAAADDGRCESPVLVARLTEAADRVGESTADVLRAWHADGRLVDDVHVGVPLAVHAWLRAPRDLAAAVEPLIRLGGACHPAATIAGALAATTGGEAAIPDRLLSTLGGMPWGPARLRRLATELAAHTADGKPRQFGYPVITPIVRNVAFRVAGWWQRFAG
jgi:ADP-ribosylglycohydrolase